MGADGPPTRRAVLSALGATVVAGCSALTDTPTPTQRPDADADGVPDTEDDYPFDLYRSRRVFHEEVTVTLDPDTFEWFRFETGDGAFELNYEVSVSGVGTIDCLAMTPENFARYREREDARVIPPASTLDVGTATVEAQIVDQEVVLSFDYTNFATDPASFPVEVTATVDVGEAPFSNEYEPTATP